MTIWVDADACPGVIKEILYRAAVRKKTHITFVANHFLSVPRSEFIHFRQVVQGFDIADNEIVRQLEPGDLVITQDIPLAAETIEAKALALSPRGEPFTRHNIRTRLNMRDFYDTLRGSGIQSAGPAALNQKDRQNFARELDRYLAS